MIHSGLLHRLDISTFYFYEPLLFPIFFPWKFINTQSFPCLVSLSQPAAKQITISINIFICFRSSRPGVFCKIGVLRNFTKFTGKYVCQSLFFNKKETLTRVFYCEFCEIPKNAFFIQHPRTRWLLLLFQILYSMKSDAA